MSVSLADHLTAILRRVLALPNVSVTPAADTRFGDYQTNAAMALAKERKTNPRALAAEMVAQLSADAELATLSEPPTIAGPGFINFTLKPGHLADRVAALLADDRLGVPQVEKPQRIAVDFSSPNIAKPMHVGHLRSTLIGDCLVRVARFLGHTVITDNHLGDWGTQFGKVIHGWKAFLDRGQLEADAINELVRVYIAADAAAKADAAVADLCRQELTKLQAGDPENMGIWRECVRLSLEELNRTYARLGIQFDYVYGESHYNAALPGVVERLLAAGIARESDGAICVFFEDHPRLADAPAIVRKKDGGFNYTTSDIATAELRVQEWKCDQMWCVVGAPQSRHFEALNVILERMGLGAQITHIPFGSILGPDRKIMRTRSGDNVSLRELLDEAEERAAAPIAERNPELPLAERAEIARVIGLGAVKYAELSQHRLTDYIFDWDRMLAFQGNTAPYLQNAYVRIRSIFRKLDGAWSAPAALGLTEPAEKNLAKKLAQFAEAVPSVLDDFRPNLLANYLYELADAFHGFYESCPVLKAEGAARETRLALCEATARVLRGGLGLMGIGVPERM
ncbi:MAG: arginine--tRNA ligase [Verrucomicrobia bacterium]|nr:arginine--tRNA ligase [Verrucomicrobiota bacterium]